MPVFKAKKREPLLTVLYQLRDRMVLHHQPPPLTADEVYKALVRPEHLAALNTASEVCGVIQRHDSTYTQVVIPGQGSLATIAIHFSNKLERLLPAYAENGFHEFADADFRDSITAWVGRRWQIAAGFALAKAAFNRANNDLSSPSQFRIYFPGLLTLMSQSDDDTLRERAAMLSDAPVPASLPSLPPELRRTLMDATKLIARAILLAPTSDEAPEVTLTCGYSNLGSIELPWNPSSAVDLE